VGGLQVQGLSGLHRQFQATLGYVVGFHLKKQKQGHSHFLSRDNLLLVYQRYVPFLINFAITFTTKKEKLSVSFLFFAKI
jgi:hypothetical protein